MMLKVKLQYYSTENRTLLQVNLCLQVTTMLVVQHHAWLSNPLTIYIYLVTSHIFEVK